MKKRGLNESGIPLQNQLKRINPKVAGKSLTAIN
jgi:hypothetical protein